MVNPRLVATDVRGAFDAAEVDFLGKGTFGETWRVDAIDIVGEPTVCAVKFLDPSNFHAALVQREIDGLTVVSGVRFARLHEVREVDVAGVLHTTLVCEYLPGGDVAANLNEFGLPGQHEAVAFAVELLHGVKQLHDVDRVHRDLKPANIILRDGRWESPVLIDMGLSKGASDVTMTAYPQRVGSLIYMAPEQLRGERARKSSDLWACGVILFTLLTGQHPYVTSFEGKSEDDIVEEITGPPAPLPAHVDARLRKVIVRLLSEDAFERGSAKRALKDLRKVMK